MRLSSLLSLLLLAPAVQAAPPRLVAVLEFRNPHELVQDRLKFSARLRAALRRDPDLHVIASEEMMALVQANPAAFDRCDDADCAQVGRLLGAEVVVDGAFSRAGKGKLALNLRAVDPRNGRILTSTRIVARTERKIFEALLAAAAALSRELAGPPAAG